MRLYIKHIINACNTIYFASNRDGSWYWYEAHKPHTCEDEGIWIGRDYHRRERLHDTRLTEALNNKNQSACDWRLSVIKTTPSAYITKKGNTWVLRFREINISPAERVRKMLRNKNANWLARDGNGRWFFYENKPYIIEDGDFGGFNDFYEMSVLVKSPTLLKALRKFKEMHWKETLLSIDGILISTLLKEAE
jgi:hypothetical protein